MPHRLPGLVIALTLAFSMPAGAITATDSYSVSNQNEFLNSGAEGWYWYHDPLPEEEAEEPEMPILPPMPLPPASPVEAKAEPAPPAPFSLAWVQKMLPKYMEKAWDDPTPENVEAYFLVQRFAMDRSSNFADMAQKVVIGNSALDETMRRPWAAPGQTAANINYAEQTQRMMKKVAEHAGIWFFFKSDCPYCEAQAPILGFLEQEEFPVLAISIDGGELKSRQFQHTFRDAGHAAQLGVTATPAIFLVSEEGRFDALGMSVLTLTDLRRRILLVAARNGWLSEEDFKEASPIMNPNQQRDLSKELPKLVQAQQNPAYMFGNEESSKAMMQLAKAGTSAVTDSDNFIDPKVLVELVGKRKQGQFDDDVEVYQK